MSSVQERLKLKRAQIDTWSTQEKLCLASAVLRSGDQNWMSVSRSLRAFGDSGRPNDWFSQKSCAVQYSNLLENVEMPKRKKRTDRGEPGLETPSENIARKLAEERIEELRNGMQDNQLFYAKLQCDLLRVKSGSADNKLEDMVLGFEESKRQKIKEAEAHERWLKEREEKKLELERAWKPPVVLACPHKRKHQIKMRRNSNPLEVSSEVECSLDNPLIEPLKVDVISEDAANNVHEGPSEPKPSQTPTSPLLTSLLKSPSPAPVSQGSSILHSAITSLRGASPTITSLLSSAPCVPGTTVHVSGAPPTTVSSSLKNLVSSAIGVEQHHQPPLHNPSPAAGAPTLSMLLELPPSLPGKPLPELPSVVKTATTTVTTTVSPSTVSTVISAVPSHASTSEKLITVRTIPTTATTIAPVKKYKSTLQGEDVPLLAQDFQIDGSARKSEDVELIPVDSAQNSVVTQQLQNENKEELIEEVLIEEVVVNEDSLIISAPLADVVVATDNEVVKLKEKEREEIKQFFDMSQASEIFPSEKKESESGAPLVTTNPTIVMVDPMSSITKDNKDRCVDTLIETSTRSLPEVVDEEEAELEVVPESEVELSTDTVAEVIEISGDQVESMQTEVVTDCEPCIQELENMEVIILDKVQDLDEVEIVEDMKELGCEVVEVVMTGQEKIEDLKEEAEESNQDTMQSQNAGCDDSCSLIPETSDIAKDEQNYSFEGQAISNEEIVENTDGNSFEDSNDIQDGENENVGSLSEKEIANIKDNEITAGDSEEKNEIKFEEREEPIEKCLEEVNVNLSWDPITSAKTVESDICSDNNLFVDVEIKTNEGEDQGMTFGTETKEERPQQIICTEENHPHKSAAKKFKELEILEKESSCVVSEVPKADVKMEPKSKEMISSVKVPLNYGKENVLEAAKKSVLKEDTTEDITKPIMKQERTLISEKMKEIDEKKVVYKEKKDISEVVQRLSSKDESSLYKTTSKKESLQIMESKKVVKEYIHEEERESRKSSKIDSHMHESSPKDLGKDSSKEVSKDISVVDAITKESQNDERKLHSVDEESRRELPPSKKDNATSGKDFLILKKDPPITEGVRDTVKHDFCRRDYKEDFVRKEGAKRSYSKDDKKDYVKKRTHAKEVAKPQRKVLTDSKDSESSILDVKPFILNEREYIKEDDTEDQDRINADICVTLEYDAHKVEQPESLKITSIPDIDKTLPNPLSKESGDLSKEVDAKLEYVDNLDEKTERPIIFRSETPSTEDDKTSDVEAPKSLGRRRLAAVSALDSIPSSPASTTDEEREYKSWKKSIMLLYGRLATHKYASLFLRPITDEQAPGYSSVVYRPIDLLTIKKNIEMGVIRTTIEFQRDVMLMFLNSIMYNKSSHFVHKMALQMQSEGMQHIQDYLTTQMLVQVAGDSVPIRRETRTMEANKQREMLSGNVEEGEGSKRKRNVVSDADKTMKRKKVDE